MCESPFCCTSRRANEGRLYPVDPPKLRVRCAEDDESIFCHSESPDRRFLRLLSGKADKE